MRTLDRDIFTSKRFRYRLAIIVVGIILLIAFSLLESFAANSKEPAIQPEEQMNDEDNMEQLDEDAYKDALEEERFQENVCYENKIAITFDDGPRNATTEELLEGLKERGVKATFFLIGKSAETAKDVVKRMQEDGHLIGSHTYSHVELDTLGVDNALSEINQANDVIEEITGVKTKYIRPPYGKYSDKLLMSVNMIPVLWTVDPVDWNTTNINQIVHNVVSSVKCGDIILLHDIYPTSVTAALEIIDQLQAKGFVFVTVDQLLLD